MSEKNEKEVIEKEVVEKKETSEKQPITKEPKTGVVADCVRLNVRKSPSFSADVVTEISAGSIVEILDDKTTNDFYHVCTAIGIDGYCIKKFIKIE